MLGAASKKLTMMGGSRSLGLRDSFGTLRCCHTLHDVLIGLNEEGRFKMRGSQSYPSEFCKRLAACLVVASTCISLLALMSDSAAVPEVWPFCDRFMHFTTSTSSV